MSKNLATTLKIKATDGTYNSLYPALPKNQIIGWNIGEIKGPYVLTVKADGWVEKRQIIDLPGVAGTDVLNCVKILEGTKEQMQLQSDAYKKLNHIHGIQSLNNQVMFECDSIPSVDFKVQVWWTI